MLKIWEKFFRASKGVFEQWSTFAGERGNADQTEFVFKSYVGRGVQKSPSAFGFKRGAKLYLKTNRIDSSHLAFRFLHPVQQLY